MSVMTVEQLSKTYRVADKEPGFVATVKHFVKRKYRHIEAVKDVNFTIEPGEIVGFLGPNGAGKTTTLKMLTGLIHPTSGQVRVVDHEPFKRQSAFLKQITLVMGNKQQMIWDLPPLDSLRINAAVYGLDDATAKRRIDELASLLELGDELTQPVRKLSLGQRMKAELVAALLHHPKVLFLDEPTLGLDVNAQTAVRAFLQDYNAKHGAAILLTSHYMADITALCKRVIVIDKGSILYDGSLQGVVERFAPFREIKVQTEVPIEAGVLEAFGEIESHEGVTARLLVQREALTGTLDRMLGELPIEDLTVADPPIEDVIAKLFASGRDEEAKTDEEAKASEEVVGAN